MTLRVCLRKAAPTSPSTTSSKQVLAMSFPVGDVRNFFALASLPMAGSPSGEAMPVAAPSTVQNMQSPGARSGSSASRRPLRGAGNGGNGGSGGQRATRGGRGAGGAVRGAARRTGGRGRHAVHSGDSSLIDDAAELSGQDDEDEQPEASETDNDRRFINDDAMSTFSSLNGFRGPEDNLFARHGPMASYDPEEEPAAKKTRRLPKVLQALQPLGLYCDYTTIMPFARLLPRISHLVSPYTWYHRFSDTRCATAGIINDNEFLSSALVAWLQDHDEQLRFARLFASYGNTDAEPLRQLARMQVHLMVYIV